MEELYFFSAQVDLTELLQGSEVAAGDPRKAACVWRDARFTLKYSSDALFDFPHWFGFSKRAFKVNLFPFLLLLRGHAGSDLSFFPLSIEAENDAGQKDLKRIWSSEAFCFFTTVLVESVANINSTMNSSRFLKGFI